MATKKTTKAATTPREYKVRYIPEHTLRAVGGAKGAKSYVRPFLFDVRTYMIETQSDGTKVNTYLLFGGVPSRKLHEKLDEVGFKVRRRARTWKNKDGAVTDIADQDNQCFAVYYTLEPVTKEQAAVIAKLFMASQGVKDTGKSFLRADWASVEKAWGDKEDWLSICAVNEDSSKPAPTVADDDDEEETINLAGADDFID